MKELILCGLLLLSTLVFAEEAAVKDEVVKEFEDDLVPIPVVYYTPETGVAAGATLIYTYRQPGQKRSSQKSSLFPVIVYTQNKQTIFVTRSRHSYDQDAWRQNAIIFYSLYPNRYFGIGDDTKEEDEEIYDSANNRFNFGIGRRIVEHLYLGVNLIYRNTRISDYESGGIIDSTKPIGYEGGREQALGYYLNYDSADDNFNPSRGVRAEIAYNQYRERYGSSFDYEEVLFKVSHYIGITASGQIAFEISAQKKTGDVPFTSLALLGGQRLMRGIFEGRFRDKNLSVLQVEWREKVSLHWGWVAFASAGHVAPAFNELSLNRALLAYGAGARFTVNQKANTVIRIDSGLTAEGYGGTYFGIGQAF